MHAPSPHETWNPNVLAFTVGILIDPHNNPVGSRGVYLYTHLKEEAAEVQKSSLAD